MLAKFLRLTLAIGDAFGSESTETGRVAANCSPSIEAAARVLLPKGLIAHRFGFDEFFARYVAGVDSRAGFDFAALVARLAPEFAHLAPPGFDPNAHSRGAFRIGVQVFVPEVPRYNILIVFERVET